MYPSPNPDIVDEGWVENVNAGTTPLTSEYPPVPTFEMLHRFIFSELAIVPVTARELVVSVPVV